MLRIKAGEGENTPLCATYLANFISRNSNKNGPLRGTITRSVMTTIKT
jgi:hypothetical protein